MIYLYVLLKNSHFYFLTQARVHLHMYNHKKTSETVDVEHKIRGLPDSSKVACNRKIKVCKVVANGYLSKKSS